MPDDHFDDRERRKQKRRRALGTQHPICCVCGEDDPLCLEHHHIEGQAYGETLSIVCRNCHRKLSDTQHDHPEAANGDDRELAASARFLIGLADMLDIAALKLRDVARDLIARARGGDVPFKES